MRNKNIKDGVRVHNEAACKDEAYLYGEQQRMRYQERDFGIQARGVSDKGKFRAVGPGWRGALPAGAAANAVANFAGNLRTPYRVGDGLGEGARRRAVRDAREKDERDRERRLGQGRGRQPLRRGRQPLSLGPGRNLRPQWRRSP